MNEKSIEGNAETGWACRKVRPSQLVAADASRRSGRIYASCGRQGTFWTTSQASIVVQDPPTHVGGYRVTCDGRALNSDAPNRESSISKSLICKTALRKSLISMIVSDIFTHIGRFLMPSDNLTLSFHDGLG